MGKCKYEQLIEEKLLKDIVNGYKIMADINLELSEFGLEEDYKDFKNYEESIMGSGKE